ncbi:MAG TPA: GFA family protein [Burkholderiaceae bacterium]
MTAPTRTASCCCGQLKAVTTAEPIRVSVCHCLACQRRTGGVFASQARFPASAVTIAGTSSTYVRVGDAGGRGTFHFCPTCGTTVYYVNQGSEDSVAIPVGAFADPDFPAPTVSVYEERMHAWVNMPADIEHIF